jgi:hypothetical protein
MKTETIICPNCHAEIPLTEAITHRITESIKREKEHEIQEIKQSYEAKIQEEKKTIDKQAKERAELNVQVDLEDLRSQIIEKDKKIAESIQKELEYRKKERSIREREEALDLEIAKRIDQERSQVAEDAIKGFQDNFRLQLAEKDKQIKGLSSTVDELQRKLSQSSQQLVGEVQELELEEKLHHLFPNDEIEPITKGVRGADILQKVHHDGKYCGSILWESKRAKSWSKDWILKLKSDQREINADIAVLYTTTFPKDMKNFGFFENVWITDYSSAEGLGTALRFNLIELTHLKIMSEGKNEKMEQLYNYLTGSEFKNKVQGIADSIISMQIQLQKEKRAMEKLWSARERNIQSIVINTVRMVGDMQGILGKALPEVKGFELEEGFDE